MRISVRGLTGEDEAGFAEAAAQGGPVLGLVAALAARTGTRDGAAIDQPLSLTIGEVQAAALSLRAASMEGPLRTRFACLACGEGLEVPLEPGALVVAASDDRPVLVREGITLSFRPATVADVLAAAAAAAATAEAAAVALLARCVTATDAAGACVDVTALPTALLEAAASHLLALDPQAETVIACACPACGASLEAVLDPAQVLAAELSSAARSLPVEVLAIAARTGWTEAAILAMPRRRRRGYAAALGGA